MLTLKAQGAWDRSVSRSALPGTDIDFTQDEIRYKTLSGNTVFTISNPTLGAIVIVELDGAFTVTLPASVNVVNGDYCPALGKNYLYLFCNDSATPEYQAVWTVNV